MLIMTILTSGWGQTDRQTDIATYRAALAAIKFISCL